MSDISISANTPLAMAMEHSASGNEATADTAGTVLSGHNPEGADSQEQTVAGTEVASRTSDYMGTGPDWSSTGTDNEFAKIIQTTLNDGMGSITDRLV